METEQIKYVCVKNFKDIIVGDILNITQLNHGLYPFNGNKNIGHIDFDAKFFETDTATLSYFKKYNLFKI